MAKFTIVAALAAVTAALAAPAPKPLAKRAAPGQADIDTVILNYALTLEHLENAFYRDQLPTAEAFREAGYAAFIHDRFIEIGGHERHHVALLSAALGDKAVKECTYDFGITGPASFIATSQLLEGTGVSAYLGAAVNITSDYYLLVAGSILTTEARHSSWVQQSASKLSPAGSPYDTPLDFNQTYSLAAPLIKSCPDSNAKLPVMAFPSAKFKMNPKALGDTVELECPTSFDSSDKVAFIGGYGATVFAPIMSGNKVTLPEGVTWGRTYAVIVKGDATKVTDDNTVAGPIPFDILPTAEQAAAKYGMDHY